MFRWKSSSHRRLNTYHAHVFRTWLVGKGTLEGKAAGIRDVHTERKNRVLLNTHKKKKGNGQPVWSCRFLFHAAALFHRFAVVRLQQFTQPRFGVKHLPPKKDKGQHPVVAVLLQGAAADTEQFRHLLSVR